MKKVFLFAILTAFFHKGFSQQLSQATFSGATTFAYFSLTTNENVLIRISAEGNIIEFGTEQQSLYNRNYYAQKLLPYLGRVDYYPNESDSAFKGKIRNIGSCFFTYYSSGDYPERIGKIKSAGSLSFDYYRKFDDVLSAGKIKNIGSAPIAYYSSVDDEAFKGKLRMVGNTSITYYSSYEKPEEKGKVKTIGTYRYAWTYLDQTGINRSSNMPLQRQLINNIIYIMQ